MGIFTAMFDPLYGLVKATDEVDDLVKKLTRIAESEKHQDAMFVSMNNPKISQML